MFERLRVQDLAIVDDVSVSFGEGLNIVTGETGAGKSVLIGAIDLLAGGRADRSLVRAGSAQCIVEAVLRLADTSAVDACLAEAGLPPCEDGLLLIRRIVSATGAGRNLVNDASTTVQTLRRVGALLVDLHGPHDNQSLFDPAFQLDVLDAFGRHPREREAYAGVFREQQELLARRQELSADDADADREADLLSYQVNEIRTAKLTEADGGELVQAHADAANAEHLLELGQQVSQLLSEGEPSALALLGATQHALAEMAQILGDNAEAWHEESRSIAVQIQELARAIEDRTSAIDASPEHLAALEERMALVQKLRRKYGGDIPAILAFCEKAEERLADLNSRGERLAEVDAALVALEPRMSAAAEALSARRRTAAGKLERAILAELRDLGFKDALFRVELRKTPYGPSGADSVEFGFAPNPGEPMRALRDIASSGEISRVMLAVKTVLADHDRIPVLVFDEIDANIGGEIGNAVGAKMRQIGDRNHQVICITHLPQVAVYGRCHAVVSKAVSEGRTKVRIEAVAGDDRVREVARMLGGATLTSVTLHHAREMLERIARTPSR